jgi:hypothetical protein
MVVVELGGSVKTMFFIVAVVMFAGFLSWSGCQFHSLRKNSYFIVSFISSWTNYVTYLSPWYSPPSPSNKQKTKCEDLSLSAAVVVEAMSMLLQMNSK